MDTFIFFKVPPQLQLKRAKFFMVEICLFRDLTQLMQNDLLFNISSCIRTL